MPLVNSLLIDSHHNLCCRQSQNFLWSLLSPSSEHHCCAAGNHKAFCGQCCHHPLNTTAVLQAITKPFNYAIVDEVDSLLIDSCRDPLMISAAASENLDRFGVAKEVTFCTFCTTFCNTVCNTLCTPCETYYNTVCNTVCTPCTTCYNTACNSFCTPCTTLCKTVCNTFCTTCCTTHIILYTTLWTAFCNTFCTTFCIPF